MRTDLRDAIDKAIADFDMAETELVAERGLIDDTLGRVIRARQDLAAAAGSVAHKSAVDA
jgi:hypothetical protein